MISTQVAAAQATDQIEDRCLRLRARADSQDAWIFRAPVRFRGVRLVAFPRRCDRHGGGVLVAWSYRRHRSDGILLRWDRCRRCDRCGNYGSIDSTRAGAAPGNLRHGVGKGEVRQPRRVRPRGGGLRRRKPSLRAAPAPCSACLLLRQRHGVPPEDGAELHVAGRGAGRDALRATRGPVGFLSFVCCSTSRTAA